jgi:hypothetical protein
MQNNFPFKEYSNGKISIRKFSQDIDDHELKWHKDEEDRVVIPIKETNWLFQRDNQLPEIISGSIKIKAGEWHRIIKGDGDLEVKVIKTKNPPNC